MNWADEVLEHWEVRTGADGTYRLSGRMAAGERLAAEAFAPDFLDGVNPSAFGAAAGARDAALPPLVLRRGIVVAGRCVGPDGRPVAAAVQRPYLGAGRLVRADAQGRFRVCVPTSPPAPGKPVAELLLYPDGLAPRRVVVWPDQADLGDVRAEVGTPVAGEVLAADGSPLRGCVVAFEEWGGGPGVTPIRVAVKTGPDGSFRVRPLKGQFKVRLARAAPPGPDDRGPVHADGPPPAVAPQVLSLTGGGTERLSLRAGAAVTVRGTVYGPDGKPDAGAPVDLLHQAGSSARGQYDRSFSLLDWTTADAEGRYEFRGVPRGLARATIQVIRNPADGSSPPFYVDAAIVAGGTAGTYGVNFESIDADMIGLDFRLRPAPAPAAPRTLTPGDRELVALGEQAERLEEAFRTAREGAQGDPARKKAFEDGFRDTYPPNVMAAKFLGLAERLGRSPAALGAIAYVVQAAARSGRPDWPVARAKSRAVDLAAGNNLDDPDLALLFPFLRHGAPGPDGERLLRAALAKSPHAGVRAAACYELALTLRAKASWPAPHGGDGEKLLGEAERLLHRCEEEFGDCRPAVYRAEGPGLVLWSRDTGAGAGKTYREIARSALSGLRGVAVGDLAPEIEGRDAYGTRFRLTEYRGKVVILTFSGNWCGPCRAMYPQERGLVARWKDRPFALLSVDNDPQKETLRHSLETKEITWRCWWDGQEGPIAARWGVESFPTTFVLDAKGVVRAVGLRGKELEEFAERLLKEAK
jgi:thiol-disulfide isomerase/thioredoxin